MSIILSCCFSSSLFHAAALFFWSHNIIGEGELVEVKGMKIFLLWTCACIFYFSLLRTLKIISYILFFSFWNGYLMIKLKCVIWYVLCPLSCLSIVSFHCNISSLLLILEHKWVHRFGMSLELKDGNFKIRYIKIIDFIESNNYEFYDNNK